MDVSIDRRGLLAGLALVPFTPAIATASKLDAGPFFYHVHMPNDWTIAEHALEMTRAKSDMVNAIRSLPEGSARLVNAYGVLSDEMFIIEVDNSDRFGQLLDQVSDKSWFSSHEYVTEDLYIAAYNRPSDQATEDTYGYVQRGLS